MITVPFILLCGAVALGVFFLVDALFYYLGGKNDPGQKRLTRRLKEGPQKDSSKGPQAILRQDRNGSTDSGFFLDGYLQNLLQQADSEMALKNVYFSIFALTFAMAGASYLLLPHLPLLAALFAGLFLSFVINIFFLKRQGKKRLAKFEEQLPDAIELVIRSLRVGQPFSRSINTVGSEMADPIAKEFRITGQEIAYGRDLPDALDDMLERIPLPDLRFFVVAVQIHHESGGNLAEILGNLSKIVRGRFRLMRKVKALTVEGRFSAWFLSLFPVLMIVIMNAINPGYYAKVADFPWYPHLVALTAFLLIVNVIAMRLMTKLEV